MFESPEYKFRVGWLRICLGLLPELPDNKYYIFGKEGAKKLADEKGLRLLGQFQSCRVLWKEARMVAR